VRGAEVHIPGYDLVGHLATAGLLGASRVLVVQSDHITLDEYRKLGERLTGVELAPLAGFLADERGSKEESEIEAIRRAQHLTEAVFAAVVPMIAPGVTERDLAAEIVYQHLRRGADAMAFEPIVASGRRGALPHARASSKALASGDFVVIDMGCYLDGYASDMTRTVALGTPEPGMARAYDAVREALEQASAHVRAGASGKAVDAVARGVLLKAGLADYFTHGLGHGVGLEVHEGPRLSHRADDQLLENAVVTVEPGVYLPERFGVRIEDLVVARAHGPEVLTRVSHELMVL
jgi:Xaa-Pro aminopeptidase